MKVTRVIGFAAIAAVLGLSAVNAQSLRSADEPAEFPPASYKGKQYVDSTGCVFIRAGIDGNVTWVPRVSRDRKVVCGFQPTLAPTAAVEPAPTKPVETIEVVETTKPAQPAQPAAAIAPIARPTAKTKAVAAKPAPRRVAYKTVETVAQPVTPQVQSACPNASAKSQRYINDGHTLPVRCGPQALHPEAVAVQIRTAVVASQSSVSPTARIVPKHVYENRANTRNVTVPKGYRAVWEDDRLNPYRAEQSLRGHEQTNLVWTHKVPRRLVKPSNARKSISKPIVIYRQASQSANGQAIVSTKGTQVKARPNAARAATKVKGEALAGLRYVQVGTFGNSENASRSALRIKRTGLPVRIGKYNKGAQTYRIVLAGPFASDQQTNAALAAVRRAGFTDAFARK